MTTLKCNCLIYVYLKLYTFVNFFSLWTLDFSDIKTFKCHVECMYIFNLYTFVHFFFFFFFAFLCFWQPHIFLFFISTVSLHCVPVNVFSNLSSCCILCVPNTPQHMLLQCSNFFFCMLITLKQYGCFLLCKTFYFIFVVVSFMHLRMCLKL